MPRSLEQISQEYRAYWTAYKGMVGSLYPSIAYGKMTKLKREYIDAGGNGEDLPCAYPPNAYGYAGGVREEDDGEEAKA